MYMHMYMCTPGYRLIKIVLFLIGFLMGFAVCYFIILGFTHDRPEHWIPYVALVGAAVVGLIFGEAPYPFNKWP